MFTNLIDFLSFKDYNTMIVLLTIIVIGGLSAFLGVFNLLNQKALLSDAIAHAVLPGIATAFIFSETKNLLVLLFGATLSGLLSAHLVNVIVTRSKIKPDTAIAVVLASFFGLGIVLLTFIQHSGNAHQSGVDRFIFGQTAAINFNDFYVTLIVALIVLFILILFYKTLIFVAFNRDHAQLAGFKVARYDFLLTFITVLTIAVGIQSIGVVLISALLITPAATARLLSWKIKNIIAVAVFVGIGASILGVYVSYLYTNMPTGPWIVLLLTFFVLIGIVFKSRIK